MKKAVLWFMILALMSTLFVGCASTKENDAGQTPGTADPAPETDTPKDPVTLKFSIWGNDAHKSMYEELAAKFKESNPHISVEIMKIPFNEYQQKLSIMLASNTAPDVVWIAERMIPQFLNANQLKPITELKKESDYQFDDIYASTLQLFTKGKDIHGIPFSTPPVMIYYNKNLFAKHNLKTPKELYTEGKWNYEEYLKAARTITEKESGTYGLSLIHNGWSNWHDNLTPLLWSHGAELFNTEGTKFTLNTKKAEGALNIYHDLIFKEKVHPKPGDQTTFETGKIGMLQELFSYMGKARAIKDFEWDIAPLPEGPEGRGTWMGFAGYSITKNTAHPEEALAFLKFLTSKESYKVTSQFFVPARKSVLESDDYLQNGPSPESVKMAVLDQMADAKVKPVHQNWQKIDVKIQTVMDYLHTGTIPVKEVLDMMEKEVDPLLK